MTGSRSYVFHLLSKGVKAMKLRRALFAANSALLLFAQSSWAGVWCSETVTSVVVGNFGAAVYFQTDLTCPQGIWCEAVPSTGIEAQRNRQYAQLLTAQLTGKKIAFYWLDLSSCTANQGGAAPLHMINY